MTDETTPRRIAARRVLAMGTAAATALGGAAAADSPAASGAAPSDSGAVLLAQAGGEGEGSAAQSGGAGDGEGSAAGEGEGEGSAGAGGEGEAGGEGAAGGEGEGAATAGGEGEGEGEGEGSAPLDPEIALMRDLGFMEGHMRAGLALYEAEDYAAAKTHMGHPIEEKYGAVAGPLEERGYSDLREQIAAVAEATESEAPMEEVQSRFDAARETMEAVRGEIAPAKQMRGLAELTRVAAEEYAVGVQDGSVANLHEYQDAWGFLRAVETEAGQFAEADDQAVAEAAATIRDQVAATEAAFGDMQGGGAFEGDPALLYGAAARMELAALGVN